jgi:hypothetical protein
MSGVMFLSKIAKYAVNGMDANPTKIKAIKDQKSTKHSRPQFLSVISSTSLVRQRQALRHLW